VVPLVQAHVPCATQCAADVCDGRWPATWRGAPQLQRRFGGAPGIALCETLPRRDDVVAQGVPMITIKITNVDELVTTSKGWFMANVVGAFVDLEPRVEAIIIEKLRASFAQEGIQALIQQQE
jgi:hypothetical protein